jgi:uroporphyrinogen-III synthase
MVAKDLGLQAQMFEALREFTAIASVGPVMTASLESAGFTADIVPVHPKMAALVKAASDAAALALERKRGCKV